MTGRISLLIWLCLATCPGCLHRHADIELLESELRWMEDQMYMMEDELKTKQKQLAAYQAGTCCEGSGGYTVIGDRAVTDSCSAGSSSVSPNYEIVSPGASIPDLRATPGEPTPADGSSQPAPKYEILENGAPQFAPDRATSEPPDELDLDVDELDGPADENDADGQPLAPPDVSLPPENDDADSPSLQPDDGVARPKDGGIILSSHADSESERPTQLDDAHVTHVVVKAWLAHGQGFDGVERAVDLLVCVEPRNADGETVPLGSDLVLVVLDATKTGDEARVARWDYSASEARRLLRRSDAGHGIHLELPWPTDVPESAELHVFARYVTVENQLLEADSRVQDSFDEPTLSRRIGWQRARRKPSTSAGKVTDESAEKLARVRNKIRLRPIPKSNDPEAAEPEAGSEQATRAKSRGDELPTILTDEQAPAWRPDR